MEQNYELGMVGLGVMGRNLVLNMADHGFTVAGYDQDLNKVQALRQEGQGKKVAAAESIEEFAGLLRTPRAVMLLVPAGPPVDAVIRDLLPHLSPGDLIIDGGNSFFKDTDLRMKALAEKKIHFLGVGISGGEEGARHGPSLMPGGLQEAYERVRPLFEAVAAKVNGEPCVAYLGPGSAGHYVKMVHNGIEYGLMQLISETYDLMKRGLNMSDEAMHQVYAAWNQTELQSYLIEITADIFTQVDDRTGGRLIGIILDEAGQKGTGMWTSQNAMDLHIPIPTIDMAVAMRDLSGNKEQREAASQVLIGPDPAFQGDQALFLAQLRHTLYFGMIATYAQGFALLQQGSLAYQLNLPMAEIARIWRGGCIIRSALLENIYTAYQGRTSPAHLWLDPGLAQATSSCQEDVRSVIHIALNLGLPVPGFMSALAYFDAYRSAWLPANLIQAQRDYFGAHTYERIDAHGVFHTEWSE